jgi:hypothetical protein
MRLSMVVGEIAAAGKMPVICVIGAQIAPTLLGVARAKLLRLFSQPVVIHLLKFVGFS